MTTFEVREFSAHDYLEYSSWLAHRDRSANEYENLPPIGVMVSTDMVNCAAGFLYPLKTVGTASSIASNPFIDASLRDKAVEALIDGLREAARQNGLKKIFFLANRPRLLDRLKRRNFVVYDSNLVLVGGEV